MRMPVSLLYFICMPVSIGFMNEIVSDMLSDYTFSKFF